MFKGSFWELNKEGRSGDLFVGNANYPHFEASIGSGREFNGSRSKKMSSEQRVFGNFKLALATFEPQLVMANQFNYVEVASTAMSVLKAYCHAFYILVCLI